MLKSIVISLFLALVPNYTSFVPQLKLLPKEKELGRESFSQLSSNQSTVIYVDIDANGNDDGTSWSDAYNDLSLALFFTHQLTETNGAFYQIWVAEGTYSPLTPPYNIEGTLSEDTFFIGMDIQVYGGFKGNETSLAERDWSAAPTILTPASEFSFEEITLMTIGGSLVSGGCVLDGFTLKNGRHSSFNDGGGAMRIFGAGFTSPIIRNCRFESNYSSGQGGAVYIGEYCEPIFLNCIFYDNEAVGQGGAICSFTGEPVNVFNCTFYKNRANEGDALYFSRSGFPAHRVYNCILWDSPSNTTPDLVHFDGTFASQLSVWGSIIYDGCPDGFVDNPYDDFYQGPEENPITSDADPLFVDEDNGDFRLKKLSPAIDKGVLIGFQLLFNLDNTDVDIEGNDRVRGAFNPAEPSTAIDLGAYEYQAFIDSGDRDGDGLMNACDNCPDNANSGLDLDGIDDYVSIPDHPALDLGSNFTIEALIYKRSFGDERILDKSEPGSDEGYSLDTANDKLRFTSKDVLLQGNTTLAANTWYHVIIVYQSDMGSVNVKLYLNGQLDNEASYPAGTAVTPTNFPLNIGKPGSSNANDGTYNGIIDEVRIYGSAKIPCIDYFFPDFYYNSYYRELDINLEKTQYNLIAYYRFNEGKVNGDNGALTSVNDLTGNGHDGELLNFTKSGSSSNWVIGAPVINEDLDGNGIGLDCEAITVQVNIKAFLQSPLAGNTMSDQLRTGQLLPDLEPYSALPNFTHVNGGGGENIDPYVLLKNGNDAIVDLVFLELRSADDQFMVVATQSALLQRDGDIVSTDGTSAVKFSNVPDGNYYVAVRHRNHLGMMTANAVSLN